MKEKQRFILVFLLTIIITRVVVFFIPRTTFIYTDQFHHSFIGIFLFLVYLFIRKKSWSYYLLAILLALIIDQVTQAPFYITKLFNYNLAQDSFWTYWSNYSVTSTIIAIIISILLIWKYKK